MGKCFIVSYNGISNAGGVERVCHYVSEIMREKGYNVVIVDKQIIESSWLGHLIKIVLGKVTVLLSSFIASIYVIQHKKKNDIVITNGFNCPYVNADLLFVHGTMQGYCTALGIKTTSRGRIPWHFECMAVRRAKNIVSVSNNAIQEVKKFYYSNISNYCVINNMVDEDRFFVNKRLNRGGILKIIFCGRLDKGKGVTDLCKLCEYIDTNELDACLLIAANNPHNKELLSSYKCVEINIGLTVDTLNDFYNQGDVMYFPSMYEGFEMVTLEALSAGVPVLGNRVGAVGELTERHEPGCEVIENTEPEFVFNQLKKMAERYSSLEDKKQLHDYYAINYGKVTYIKKLENVLSKITQ